MTKLSLIARCVHLNFVNAEIVKTECQLWSKLELHSDVLDQRGITRDVGNNARTDIRRMRSMVSQSQNALPTTGRREWLHSMLR
jgi:predicted transport protein